ncbi:MULTISPECIES: hypothetical protein [Sorangium]|uniref:Uncharacterized protein n=1 Tax=Sorangium cellulosum TaxID=56 RepID=A0A4P2QW44_SORCE|nr:MULTISPECIES: hypothetical protein [Sorangium]AUX34680.1 hypothetical protein SOCE836_068560 [Sorangium cellulosum]WCQ93992.1 hypothetical protein NQZ70_06749 [Sorangium sp. Soce836]
MARLTLRQKAVRVLQLLMGLRRDEIAAALVAHGFTDADLAEGWRLLQGLTRPRLDIDVRPSAPEPDLIAALDGWENRWFPIAAATLKRRHPEVHAWMFRNLGQTEGAAVVVSVGTFVERWDQLARRKDKGGPGRDGREARKLLAWRGITREVVDEARELLARAEKVEPAGDRSPADPENDGEQAEADLWGWYLEWSAVVRSAIQDRKLLRELGYLRPSGRPSGGTTPAAQPPRGSVEPREDESDSPPRPRPTRPRASAGRRPR